MEEQWLQSAQRMMYLVKGFGCRPFELVTGMALNNRLWSSTLQIRHKSVRTLQFSGLLHSLWLLAQIIKCG